MKTRRWTLLLPLACAACLQVGPKEEPLHIILDVNIKVQIERDVEEFWDAIEEDAEVVDDAEAEDGGAE